MPKEVLDEREFELVNIIGAKLGSNQRDLSRQMNLSLGQTNMLVRRLVSKGFIRISQLNQRKVKYLLTPKGISEKMRKTVKYTLNTINSIGLIKEGLGNILSELYEDGERVFYILGKSDFSLLIDMMFREESLQGCQVTYLEEVPVKKIKGILLICKEKVQIDPQYVQHSVNLVHELVKDESFAQYMGQLNGVGNAK